MSRNVVFLENQYFFPRHDDLNDSVSHLLAFSEAERPPVTCFMLNFVYERRKVTDDPPFGSPTMATIHALDPPSDPPALLLSTRHIKPPNRYGFTHASLLTTLSYVSIPNSYS